MLSDADIAQKTTLAPMAVIAKKLKLPADALIPYGHNKAKIAPSSLRGVVNKHGKIVLVTAINPTPAGEGKTTVTIGLADALNGYFKNHHLPKQAAIALREPSLGPVFGMKGGAAGGGYAQVLPMDDINLHFTGDFHAITAANNLLAALLDNHIYQGNALGIDPARIVWRRVLDMNDRQLRHITSGQGKTTDGITRTDGFDITVASEVMAVFCLARDLDDLKRRLGEMVVAYGVDGQPIFARDLQAQGAMTALLKEAFSPNLVQTIEQTPAFIHGGPFANIAHGCNSLVATRVAQHLADIVVTEAGFGADLGAEKFCDIKCRLGDIAPDVCVIVATVRALKYNGGVAKDALNSENIAAVQAGLANLLKHIDTMQTVFGLPVVVALNHFSADSDAEVQTVMQAVQKSGASIALAKVWAEGGAGGQVLAQEVLKALDAPKNFRFAYDSALPLKEKIAQLAAKIYGADGVDFSADAEKSLQVMGDLGDGLPICMAKTQYSLSDDPKQLGVPRAFRLTVRDVVLAHGAGFVVVICGNIMKMPGLPKTPAANHIDVIHGQITGLF